jgi:hypothetical protein
MSMDSCSQLCLASSCNSILCMRDVTDASGRAVGLVVRSSLVIPSSCCAGMCGGCCIMWAYSRSVAIEADVFVVGMPSSALSAGYRQSVFHEAGQKMEASDKLVCLSKCCM